jgi:hypothetical protein
MNQTRKINIFLAGLILVALIVCGVIGYKNDSGRVSPFKTPTNDALPTNATAEIELVYCYTPVRLCINSFGSDNAGHMLIVIKNNIPGLVELYAKINQTGTPVPDLYPCQKVQFTPDIYYCMGNPIADGTLVTIDVYSKNDDQLVASGSLPVGIGATPVPVETTTPTTTMTASATQISSTPATQTPSPSATLPATQTLAPSATTNPATRTLAPSATHIPSPSATQTPRAYPYP